MDLKLHFNVKPCKFNVYWIQYLIRSVTFVYRRFRHDKTNIPQKSPPYDLFLLYFDGRRRRFSPEKGRGKIAKHSNEIGIFRAITWWKHVIEEKNGPQGFIILARLIIWCHYHKKNCILKCKLNQASIFVFQ